MISALQIVDHLFPLKTAAICGFEGTLCCCKCATHHRMDATAHARGCPVAPCTIDSPLTPFFCIVKRRLTKVAEDQVEEEAGVFWVGWVPTKNWTRQRVKGVETVSDPPMQYSLVRRRKKKSIQARSVISFPLGKMTWSIESMPWRPQTKDSTP